MKIIDANTGQEVRIGRPFVNIDGRQTMIQIREKAFSAKAEFMDAFGRTRWLPLVVRYTHPRHFLRKVAFIPS